VIGCSSVEGAQPCCGETQQQQQQGRVRHRAAAGSAAGSSRGSLLGSSARPVAALLDVSTSGSFLQQQLQQIRRVLLQQEPQQQAGGPVADNSSTGSTGHANVHNERPAAAAEPQLPVGSPIEGLGVLRRSLSQLPTGHCLRPVSAPVRLSLSEERLSYERASQQDLNQRQQHVGFDGSQQQQMRLEEHASLVLGRLLDGSVGSGS
jgi:hypothetical protein